MASTIVASCAIVPEVLNQRNYKDWSARVETYLLAKDLWDVVVDKAEPSQAETYVEPQSENERKVKNARAKSGNERKVKNESQSGNERKVKNARALHAIKVSCGPELFSSIRDEKIAKEAWERLKKKFKGTDPNTTTISELSGLHKPAAKGNLQGVKQLLSSMRDREAQEAAVTEKDRHHRTALDHVIVNSCEKEHWIEIARCMIDTNREILKIPSDQWNKYIPVVRACSRNKWQMARFLLTATPHDAFQSDENRRAPAPGAQLINMCIWRSEGLDVAWNLLHQQPRLAMADNGFGQQPMVVLAGLRTAFRSGARLTLWQKLIYKSIRIQRIDFSLPESRITVRESEDDDDEPSPGKRSGLHQVIVSFRRAIIDGFLKVLGIYPVYEMKLNHSRFKKFMKRMLIQIKADLHDDFTPAERTVMRTSLFKAVEHGHVEFVRHMRGENQRVLDFIDDEKRSIFQYAIEHRREKIYNLIHDLNQEEREDITHKVAKFKTNMLHSAANLSQVTRFNHIQGASLQMQRELQWFKEVESMLPSEMHEYVNNSNLTARELFTINHKKLKDEAELSTKGIATSCTTVGALIVTIMFAVAFTVPGGTNDATGLPMFIHKKLFRIFMLSDTISLASSATSVITFLGLLTSTYAEDDFLWSLPTKMMIGLSTLFVSIAAMMITFSCALAIMLDGEAKMIITGILFATIPVGAFVCCLFPLLFEIFLSTYGPSMFPRKSKIGIKRRR